MKSLVFENTMCDPIHEENNWMFIASNGDTVLYWNCFYMLDIKAKCLKNKEDD